MQVRCQNCNRPYAVNKDEIHALLDQIQAEGLKYQSSYCPHCSRPKRHTKKQLRMFAPTWKPQKQASAE